MGSNNPKDLLNQIDKKYYTRVFDSSSEGVLILDAQFIITYTNPWFCSLLGFSAAELIGKSLLALIPVDELAVQKINLQNRSAADPPGSEITFLDHDRLPVYCSLIILPIQGEKDSLMGSFALIRDISETKKAADDFLQVQERTQLAAQAAKLGIWEWDIPNDHLIWNERMFELYGISPKKFKPIYASWLKTLHPDDAEISDRLLKQSIDTGVPYDTGFRIRLPDKSVRYIKAWGKVIYSPSRDPIRILGINLDITDKKWAEKANQLMAEAQWQIVNADGKDQIFQIVGQKIQEIIENGYTAVTVWNEVKDSIHIQWVYGMGEKYKALVDKLKIDPTSIEFSINEIDPATLEKYRSGKLEQFQGGLYLLAQKKVPKSICQAVEKALSISTIYTIGFAWENRHYGGVIISPRKDIGPVLNNIEAIVNLATQALKRLHSEKKMRESEERFRSLFENSPIALWEEDFSLVKKRLDDLRLHGVTDFNKYFAKHPAEVVELAASVKILNINKVTVKLLHAKDKSEILNLENVVFRGKENSTFINELVSISENKPEFEWEGINYTLDGEPLLLSVKWSVAPNYQDTLAKVFISVINITERRHAEMMLRESEERFRKIFEENPVGIVLSDAQSRITSVNPMFTAILGYTQDEIVGRTFKEITFPEDIVENENLLNKLIKSAIPFFSLQKRYIHKNGEIIWTNLTVTALRDENGKLISILAMLEDISAKKRAEEAFLNEHYLLQTLMENIPDSVYFKDMESHFIRANLATAKKFGLNSVDELLGKSDEDFFIPEIAAKGLAEEKKIIESGEPRINVVEIENWKDQHPITWASSTKMALRDKSGKIVGTFGVTRDLTDIKEKEEEIKQLNTDLEDKVELRTKELSLRNQELEAFAYSISHDLKAPLRGINGYSQLLLQEHSAQLDDEGKSFLNKLISSSEQLTKLIDDLFAYSRLQRWPVNRVDFSMAEIAEAVIDERGPEMKAGKFILHRNIQDEIINSSPELVTQIFQNYLDNAIKFTSKCSTPEIWVEYKNLGATSLLSVRDNGIGFEMQQSEKIFDVFYRLHRIDEYEGTGIGLALVKKAANILGYRVWAEGKPNEGATFFLKLSNKKGK
jgi:PAS domain S-box-containing protein